MILGPLKTSLIPFRSLETAHEGRIFLKPENFQPFGSYKIRGVAEVVRDASPEHRKIVCPHT
jgi:threonine dehydratase